LKKKINPKIKKIKKQIPLTVSALPLPIDQPIVIDLLNAFDSIHLSTGSSSLDHLGLI